MLQAALITFALVLTGADHWTTYLCLRAPVPGWRVVEANPIADALFAQAGLVGGLWIDSAITLAALAFIGWTPRYSLRTKSALLLVVCAVTSYAVVNNLLALDALGLAVDGAL